MPRRLYVGGIPDSAQTRDVEAVFSRFGSLVEVTIKAGFAFVEYDDARDAEEALHRLGGAGGAGVLHGQRLRVEFAKDRRSGGGFDRPGDRGAGAGGRPQTLRCFRCGQDGHMSAA